MPFKTPDPVNEPVLGYRADSPERQSVKAELKRQSEDCREIPIQFGEHKGSGKTWGDLTVPHDHQNVVAKCQEATPEDVHAAIDLCVASREKWANLHWQERAAVFLKAADLITGPYRAEINAATMLGQSKTVHQSEIEAACELADFLRFNARYLEEILQENPLSPAGNWNHTEMRGLEGFVFAICPFNFTAINVNLAAAPLLMGCSVLWKPAPTAMLAVSIAARILEEAGLPPGVCNLVHGDPKMIGDIALQHPELSGVHFTGSSATFNHIWNTIGTNISKFKSYPRIVGETGGKDFVFAHSSADVEHLAQSIVRGSFEYQGQKCSAASRAYIPKSIWPQTKSRLVELTESITMGDVTDFKNFMSAVIDERSFDKISGYIDDAKNSSDAEIIAGGEYDKSKGYFVKPTIIEAKKPLYKSMVEEIFGPVLTIYVYDDSKFEETLKVCDESTAYALTGAIFAKDRYTLDFMSQKLKHAAGNFYINDKPTGAVVGQQPFGGSRASGTNDKAGSKLNLLRWGSLRSIKENFVPLRDYRYPFMEES